MLLGRHSGAGEAISSLARTLGTIAFVCRAGTRQEHGALCPSTGTQERQLPSPVCLSPAHMVSTSCTLGRDNVFCTMFTVHSLYPFQSQRAGFPGKAQHSVQCWSPISPAECKAPVRTESNSGDWCW